MTMKMTMKTHPRSKTNTMALVAALLLVVAPGGCSEDTIDHSSDDAGPAADTGVEPDGIEADHATIPDDDAATGDAAAGGPMLRIYIEGDLTPAELDDGLAGQTPKRYFMGLGRFDVMTAADDPSPVTVFDHGDAPVMVDMLSRTLGGERPIAELAAGTYTHGRVLLTMAEATIEATVHLGLAVPGDLTIVGALSDTVIDGKPFAQGEATFTFKVGPAEQTVPASLPALPSTAGGQLVHEAGKTWMVFPFPEPITLSASTTRDHEGTIIYKVHESFRWKDEDKAGYKPQVFDIDASNLSFEQVLNFGATGYEVTTSAGQ